MNPPRLPDPRAGTVSRNSLRRSNRYLNTIYYQDHLRRTSSINTRRWGGFTRTRSFVPLRRPRREGFGRTRTFQHDNTIYEEGYQDTILIHDPQRFQNGICPPADKTNPSTSCRRCWTPREPHVMAPPRLLVIRPLPMDTILRLLLLRPDSPGEHRR